MTRPEPSPAPREEPRPAPVTFVLDEDGDGGCYWTIFDDRGRPLARSARFASAATAELAAGILCSGAAAATFSVRSRSASADRSRHPPPAGPAAAAGDGSEGTPPEHAPRSDPGGSVSREEVLRRAGAAGAWPAGSSSTPGGPRR